MIVYAHMADMRRHAFHGMLLSQFQIALIASGIELQKRRTVNETFGPLRPPPSVIPPIDSEDGRTSRHVVLGFDQFNLLTRKLPKFIQRAFKRVQRNRSVNFHTI